MRQRRAATRAQNIVPPRIELFKYSSPEIIILLHFFQNPKKQAQPHQNPATKKTAEQSEPSGAERGRAGPSRAEPERNRPEQSQNETDPSGAEQSQNETEPSQIEPSRARSSRVYGKSFGRIVLRNIRAGQTQVFKMLFRKNKIVIPNLSQVSKCCSAKKNRNKLSQVSNCC